MTQTEELTAPEAEAVNAMLGALIDEARKRGLDLMGIDHPAIDVRAAVAAWVVAARSFKPVPTGA